MSWNPDQYLKFEEPRLRPARDLVDRIAAEAPGDVVDLGCGTGNGSRMLAARWPRARIVGIDESAEMLAQAGDEGDAEGRIRWQQASVAEWAPDSPPDLIFSNAALHWLAGHDQLFPRLLQALAPGGTLAVQIPRNYEAPSHTSIADAVRAGPWRQRLEPLLRPTPVHAPADYYAWLAPRAASVDIWETEYLQVLTGPDPVKEWTKGSWLKPLLDALQGDERAAFEADYAARVARAYPLRDDGTTLFPFKRLFIVAKAPAGGAG